MTSFSDAHNVFRITIYTWSNKKVR